MLEGHEYPVEHLAFSPDKSQVNALAFSPDGSILASCSHDGTVSPLEVPAVNRDPPNYSVDLWNIHRWFA